MFYWHYGTYRRGRKYLHLWGQGKDTVLVKVRLVIVSSMEEGH